MLINAYATLGKLPDLNFKHTLNSRRDRSDPELPKHLAGFAGFVQSRGGGGMTQTKFHVLQHIQRVRHHLSIEVEEKHMDAFAFWARSANAILFLTDSTVRGPSGEVLVDPRTGTAEAGADVPFPSDAIARKQRTETRLATMGIKVPKSLPPVVGAAEVALRDAREVPLRCLALFACAVRAESLGSGDDFSAEDLKKKLPRAFPALSPKEQAFLAEPHPEQQEIVNFAWRYEALLVLMWALGHAKMPMPTAICDVPGLAKATREANQAGFVGGAHLRPLGEILDELDFTYRLHWAARDAELEGKPPPASLEPGVLAERHYALNWLTSFQDAEWDDVDVPT